VLVYKFHALADSPDRPLLANEGGGKLGDDGGDACVDVGPLTGAFSGQYSSRHWAPQALQYISCTHLPALASMESLTMSAAPQAGQAVPPPPMYSGPSRG
jgi:hypothetical protein